MIGAAAVVVSFERLPVAPAVYVGHQDCFGLMPDFDLWNLTASVGGHPIGSTLSSDTLLQLGYQLPPKPEGKP